MVKALENNLLDSQTREGLIRWYDAITHQNYISNNGLIIIQKEGLAMGAPNSGVMAEFFLQIVENIHLAHLSEKHKFPGYFRHVDDILLIYDSNHTNIQDISHDFNTLHPT